METHSNLEEAVFRMYSRIGVRAEDAPDRNQHCQECTESLCGTGFELRGAMEIYHVGNEFGRDPRRILFAGKTARDVIDECGDANSKDPYDPTCWAHRVIQNKEGRAGKWAFWAYTRSIIRELYGDDLEAGWEQVAMTNVVKCNAVSKDSDGETNATMRESCLLNLRVFRYELDVIRPNCIVLFLGQHFDNYLGDRLFPGQWKDTVVSKKVPCGRKELVWWEGEVLEEGKRKHRILRISHPERKKKDEFVRYVVDWLNRS
jgi:hypothetical protein